MIYSQIIRKREKKKTAIKLLSRMLETTEIIHIKFFLSGLSLFYFDSWKFSSLTSHFLPFMVKDSLQTHKLGLKISRINNYNNNQIITSRYLTRHKEKMKGYATSRALDHYEIRSF